MALFHFTCDHGKRGVTARGWLKPSPHPLLDWKALLWLTDQPSPTRAQVGLFSSLLSCDRMSFRYVVEAAVDVVPWAIWADANGVDRDVRGDLEAGCDPATWFVTTVPQFAVLDRSWKHAQSGEE